MSSPHKHNTLYVGNIDFVKLIMYYSALGQVIMQNHVVLDDKFVCCLQNGKQQPIEDGHN